MRRNRESFALLELLVIIGTIAILGLLLLQFAQGLVMQLDETDCGIDGGPVSRFEGSITVRSSFKYLVSYRTRPKLGLGGTVAKYKRTTLARSSARSSGGQTMLANQFLLYRSSRGPEEFESPPLMAWFERVINWQPTRQDIAREMSFTDERMGRCVRYNGCGIAFSRMQV